MSNKHGLEFNKIAASVLLAGVIAMICGFIADGLYTPKTPEKRGFEVEVAEVTSSGGTAAVLEADIGTLLAAADAAKGDVTTHKKCASCHTFNSGEPNKVGPNLSGVVGSKIGAHAAGYAYSAALSGHGGNWDYDSLNKWLKNPGAFVKGNKMAYAGIKNDAERADVILYLKSISPSAPGLPAPKPVEAPAEAAPAAAPAEATKAPAPAAH
jgi:cytochrome c